MGSTLNDPTRRNITLYLTGATAFCLPLFPRLVPLLIALLALYWLFTTPHRSAWAEAFRNPVRRMVVGGALLYLVYLAGLIHTTNFSYAATDLQVKASLLLFPVIFGVGGRDRFTRSHFRILGMLFVTGCAAGSLMLLGRSFYFGTLQHRPDFYYYTNLSWFFHPSYFTLYLNLALAFLLHDHFHAEKKTPEAGITPWLRYSLALFFTLMIVLLSSKAGLLIWIFVISVFSLLLFFIEKRRREGILLLTVSSIVFTILLISFPHAAGRVSQAGLGSGTNPGDSLRPAAQSTGERLTVWKAAGTVALRHLPVGTGTGDVKDALLAEYRIHHFDQVLEKRLNAHNQYLQTTAALGVPGLAILLASILFPLIASLRRKSPVLFLFVGSWALSLLFESMLETQAGVTFYALFNAVLLSACDPDPSGDPLQV